MALKVTWYDSGREPQSPPNPGYPDGVDLNLSGDAFKTCKEQLPYPARRCGQYLIECETCGQTVVVTTAGRKDDPRSIEIACKGH